MAPAADAAPAAASAVAELALSASAVQQVPPPPASFETEQVREFEARETLPVPPAPSGPGYAPVQPVKIEWPADLVQVESDPGKVEAARQEEIEQQPAPRPQRVRQPVQPVSNEPLVQIETQQSGPATAGGERKETTLPG